MCHRALRARRVLNSRPWCADRVSIVTGETLALECEEDLLAK